MAPCCRMKRDYHARSSRPTSRLAAPARPPQPEGAMADHRPDRPAIGLEPCPVARAAAARKAGLNAWRPSTGACGPGSCGRRSTPTPASTSPPTARSKRYCQVLKRKRETSSDNQDENRATIKMRNRCRSGRDMAQADVGWQTWESATGSAPSRSPERSDRRRRERSNCRRAGAPARRLPPHGHPAPPTAMRPAKTSSVGSLRPP